MPTDHLRTPEQEDQYRINVALTAAGNDPDALRRELRVANILYYIAHKEQIDATRSALVQTTDQPTP